MLFLFLSLKITLQILGKSTGYFYNNINSKDTFIATKTLHHMAYHISKIAHPSLSKDMTGPVQIERGKCYSLMLLCLKINCINIRAK